jgi:hypothetical protein
MRLAKKSQARDFKIDIHAPRLRAPPPVPVRTFPQDAGSGGQDQDQEVRPSNDTVVPNPMEHQTTPILRMLLPKDIVGLSLVGIFHIVANVHDLRGTVVDLKRWWP